MRCRGRITQQHDIAIAPPLAQHPVEVKPRGTAQMARIRHQAVAAEITREDLLASGDALVEAHAVEAGAAPSRLRAFYNERRGVRVELIRVRPYPTVFSFFKNERERVVEFLMRAEPNIFAGAHVDI